MENKETGMTQYLSPEFMVLEVKIKALMQSSGDGNIDAGSEEGD